MILHGEDAPVTRVTECETDYVEIPLVRHSIFPAATASALL